MNAISASIALPEIWLPQLGPTVVTEMSLDFTPSLPDSDFSSATVWAPVSDFVWICQPFCWPWVCCTIAPLTPPDSTAFCTWLNVVDDEGKVKTAPPLKSTLKDRPRTTTATMLMTRINPEMAYHRRFRPTKSNETSPR